MSLPEHRRLVLDADINWKLAHELRKRGRDTATALKLEGIDHLKDGAVLKALAEGDYEPCVLVTWDNKMPTVHAAEIEHFGATVAVVNRSGLAAWHGNEEQYIREIVHRHAHKIEAVEAGSVTGWLLAGRGNAPSVRSRGAPIARQ